MPGLDVEHEQRLRPPGRGQVAVDDARGLARAVEAVRPRIAVGHVGQQLEGEHHGARLLGVGLGLLGEAAHGVVGRADAQRAEGVGLGGAVVGDDPEAGEDLAPAERKLGRLGRRRPACSRLAFAAAGLVLSPLLPSPAPTAAPTRAAAAATTPSAARRRRRMTSDDGRDSAICACNLCPRPTQPNHRSTAPRRPTGPARPVRAASARRVPRARSRPRARSSPSRRPALARDVGMLVPPQREALQDRAEDLPRHVHRLGARPIPAIRSAPGSRARKGRASARLRACTSRWRACDLGVAGGVGEEQPRRVGVGLEVGKPRVERARHALLERVVAGQVLAPDLAQARRSGARAGAGAGPAWRRSGRRRRAPRRPSGGRSRPSRRRDSRARRTPRRPRARSARGAPALTT